MAHAERRDAKDFLSIYSIRDWKLLSVMPVDTNDLSNLVWASNDSCIAVWDNEVYVELFIL